MPRVVSFIVLLAFITLVGSMFFQVMVQFIVPLFMAAVMVVVFKPLHLWMVERCGDRRRIAAALTTLAILLLVLLPVCGLLVRAISEGATIYGGLVATEETEKSVHASEVIPPTEPPVHDDPNATVVETEGVDEPQLDQQAVSDVFVRVVAVVNPWLERVSLSPLDSREVQETVTEKLQALAAPFALESVKFLGSTLIGLAIMVLTMYYFFSDGPSMISALKKMSPLEDAYEQELLDKFGDISRAVVVATLASAIVQGILAGIGFFFAGTGYLFLLIAATAFMSMVPFVGAAAVWLSVCIGLYFYTGNPEFPEGRPVTAIILAIYCASIVSTADNIIKPLVLHGQSKLHPLLALLSVIGGVQALGPIGILVGPMLVAFLQALLNMLNKELHLLGKEADTHGTPVVFATDLGQPAKDKAKPPEEPTPENSEKRKTEESASQ